jgi:hypothetical protein
VAITHMGLEFGEEAPRGVAGGVIEAVLHVQTDGPTRCNPLGAQHVMVITWEGGEERMVLGRSTVSGVSELPAGRSSLPLRLQIAEQLYPNHTDAQFSVQHLIAPMHGDVEWQEATPCVVLRHSKSEPSVAMRTAELGNGQMGMLLLVLGGLGALFGVGGAALCLLLTLLSGAKWLGGLAICLLWCIPCAGLMAWGQHHSKSGTRGSIKLEVYPYIACAGQPLHYRITITPDKPTALLKGLIWRHTTSDLYYVSRLASRGARDQRRTLSSTNRSSDSHINILPTPLAADEAFIYEGTLAIPAHAMTTGEVKLNWMTLGARIKRLTGLAVTCDIKLKVEVEGSEPRELSVPIIVVHGTRAEHSAQPQQQEAQAHTSAAEVKR